ncbi:MULTISPECIES: APC family permease [Spiroplasma]|uniref:APC family permease n=1 Tax=Spiroplasma TaxID=2132 RepID=UPI0018DDDFA5|nr:MULTISPECIES: APC family permease [Spiroplasma]MBH8622431.1 APC family permease [Spiroplasma sp. hyd1]UNF61459.1 APC family permease [Spiroplasma poulsonii]
MKTKKLKITDIILFTFSAIFVLDSFAAAAKIGWSSIIYWFLLAIFYFLPYGFISAELSSTFGAEGGMYVWVKKAFGRKWAARTNWLYWINVGLWMSSVYLAFSSTLSFAFFNNTLNFWIQIGIALLLTWIIIVLNFIRLEKLKWIPNLTSVAKLIVTVALIVGAIYWLANGHPVSTLINDAKFGFLPSWSTGVIFLPVIIYNFSGFELQSNATDKIDNPQKTIPKSILISGIIIIICYLIGTAAVNIIVNVNHLDEANGIIQSIGAAFKAPWITMIVAIFILFTFFGTMLTWTSGANLAIKEAAEDGEFPSIFASKLKNDTPLWASIITGIISTIVILIGGAMLSATPNVANLFWTLYAFSSLMFLAPYFLIFPAYIKLRLSKPNIERSFKIKGPLWVQWIIVLLPTIIIISVILFIFGSIIVKNDTWAFNSGGQHVTFCIVGSIIVIIVGEILISYNKWKHKKGGTQQHE